APPKSADAGRRGRSCCPRPASRGPERRFRGPPRAARRTPRGGARSRPRLKVASPLVVPLSQLAKSMSGLGAGAASLIERSFDLAALLTEVNYYRIREPLVQTPVRQLDTWLALLQDRRVNEDPTLAAAGEGG